MKGEDTLDAFAIGNFADREGFVQAAAFAGNDDASEDLDTLFVTLDDSGVNFHGVADAKGCHVLLELLGFDFSDDVAHDNNRGMSRRAVPGGAEPGKGRA